MNRIPIKEKDLIEKGPDSARPEVIGFIIRKIL